ncbi:hypothetical protein HHK36_019594 [Tetracentron sinense]|uniref:Uncharacterized protein n=1 Tax=Tetracentron sinense TaxID=13715 RepID=A0A835DCW8_TETSI|nr:hypothetical protein HHK36_019594 [Tetracentron sinense]
MILLMAIGTPLHCPGANDGVIQEDQHVDSYPGIPCEPVGMDLTAIVCRPEPVSLDHFGKFLGLSFERHEGELRLIVQNLEKSGIVQGSKASSIHPLSENQLVARELKKLQSSVNFEGRLSSGRKADVLAKFKPILNVSTLIPDLSHVECIMANSLEYFKSTRHIILYYEDLINNHKALSGVQGFLRVPIRKLQSRQVKIHRTPFRTSRELGGCLQDTEWITVRVFSPPSRLLFIVLMKLLSVLSFSLVCIA